MERKGDLSPPTAHVKNESFTVTLPDVFTPHCLIMLSTPDLVLDGVSNAARQRKMEQAAWTCNMCPESVSFEIRLGNLFCSDFKWFSSITPGIDAILN
jgi:hypothetical protein